MKAFNLLMALGLWAVAAPVLANTLKLELNLPTSVIQDGKDLPKPKSLGMAVLANGVKLPAYQVYYHDGTGDEPDMSTPSLQLTKKLEPALSRQLALYYFDQRWFLLPKDWRFVSATLGANGSSVIYFAPPQNDGHFKAWTNNGGCYGCGINTASYFFKEADRLNQREFDAPPQYQKISPAVNISTIRPHTQAWRATIGRQNIDGVVYFDLQSEAYTSAVQVSLPKAQSKLATPILNWHLP